MWKQKPVSDIVEYHCKHVTLNCKRALDSTSRKNDNEATGNNNNNNSRLLKTNNTESRRRQTAGLLYTYCLHAIVAIIQLQVRVQSSLGTFSGN